MIAIFFRETDGVEDFYLIELPMETGKTAEQMARDNAEINPGTLRVEDTTGRVLWAKEEAA